MYLMMQQPKSCDYVIGTGENHSVREFVIESFKNAGITDWEKYVVIDARFKRPAEVPDLRARSTKAQKVLGWKPKTTFKELVKMMIDADLKRYASK